MLHVVERTLRASSFLSREVSRLTAMLTTADWSRMFGGSLFKAEMASSRRPEHPFTWIGAKSNRTKGQTALTAIHHEMNSSHLHLQISVLQHLNELVRLARYTYQPHQGTKTCFSVQVRKLKHTLIAFSNSLSLKHSAASMSLVSLEAPNTLIRSSRARRQGSRWFECSRTSA